jgi:surface protein
MKNLKDIILEKLIINKNTKVQNYNYFPKDRKELRELIEKLIKERGFDADLNDIDVSEITDMHSLFLNSRFNGDISKWNVSNVTTMYSMFRNSLFNGDISKWNVSNVTDTRDMFDNSKFTGENGDISNWNVSNIEYMGGMFFASEFKRDISKWKVNDKAIRNAISMFYKSPLEKNPPKWYKE